MTLADKRAKNALESKLLTKKIKAFTYRYDNRWNQILSHCHDVSIINLLLRVCKNRLVFLHVG